MKQSKRIRVKEREIEQARAALQKKFPQPATSREERAKRARFLHARGFSMEVIARLVRCDEQG